MLGDPGPEYRSPDRMGATTVQIHMTVDDVDSCHQRARAAGAEITSELEDHPYGERSFSTRDPEGHWWTFGQTVHQVAPEQWGAVTRP